jgi:hypothetical protein
MPEPISGIGDDARMAKPSVTQRQPASAGTRLTCIS